MSHYQRSGNLYSVNDDWDSQNLGSSYDEDDSYYMLQDRTTSQNVDFDVTINPQVFQSKPRINENYFVSSRSTDAYSEPTSRRDEYSSPGYSTSTTQRKLSNSRSQIYLDPDRGYFVEHNQTPRFYCDQPGCVDEYGRRKSVGRKADLKRHMESVHAKPHINCKYVRCDKKGDNGFRRKDHYNEHLRKTHKESGQVDQQNVDAQL